MSAAKKTAIKATAKRVKAANLPEAPKTPKRLQAARAAKKVGKVAKVVGKTALKVAAKTLPTPEQKAARRLERARARDDLAPPTKAEILDFQLSFLRKSGLLVYTADPAVIASARAAKPTSNERLASYLIRVFGGRDVPVTFAQSEKREGRESMTRVFDANAGMEIQGLLARARKATRQAAEDAREEAAEEGRRKTKRLRSRFREEKAQTEAELREQRERLTRYPAAWLDDRADHLTELNDAAGANPVHHPFVISKLRELAARAREVAAEDGTDEHGAQLDFVVGELIVSLDAAVRREKQADAAHRQQVAELTAKIAKLERNH